MQYQFDVVVKQVDGGLFLAHCPSLAGCEGKGATPADAIAKLKEVIDARLRSRPQQHAMKCGVSGCEVAPTFHITGIESRRVVFEKYLCEPHAQVFFKDFRSSESVRGDVRDRMQGAACVDLEMIAYRMGYGNDPVCMYVHEVGGPRRLCILTDGWAWSALMAHVKQQPAPAPRTHATWAKTITELNGELQKVVLDRHEGEDWWSAKLCIAIIGGLVDVDVRASDAYILAVIAGVSIFVVEKALERFADRGEGTSDS